MIALIEANNHGFSIVKTLTATAILVILGMLIPNIYKNEPTMWINIIVSMILYFTIMMFENSNIGKSICYPLASALIMNIILYQTIPSFGLKETIINYSIMIIAFTLTLMIYNFLFREIIEDAKKYILKIKKLGYIIASYAVYFLTLSLWKDTYSWKPNNIDTINILIIVLIVILAMLITSFSVSFLIILIINSISKYRKLTQENEKEIKEESNQQEPMYQSILNQVHKVESNISNQKFKYLENDVQNYINTIQPFNDYEPQKRVLNVLQQAMIDIQHIAQNYENRQKINDPNMVNRYLENTYLEQAEQVKENAKALCNEFLDFVENHKNVSSTEDIQNIQIILKKLNDKEE